MSDVPITFLFIEPIELAHNPDVCGHCYITARRFDDYGIEWVVLESEEEMPARSVLSNEKQNDRETGNFIDPASDSFIFRGNVK
jgi:hypothetical protein